MSTALADSRPIPVAGRQQFSRELPQQKAPAGVHATVSYVIPPADGVELYNWDLEELPEGQQRSNIETRPQAIFVHDLRQADAVFSVDRQGFQLEHLKVPIDIDWSREEEVGLRLSRHWRL